MSKSQQVISLQNRLQNFHKKKIYLIMQDKRQQSNKSTCHLNLSRCEIHPHPERNHNSTDVLIMHVCQCLPSHLASSTNHRSFHSIYF